jgi:diaminopimelate decarboxylase
MQTATPPHATDRPAAQPPEVSVAGLSLWQVAHLAGQTPFYVYDFEAVARRIGAVRAALPDGVHLHYAVKANPMPALIQRMAPLVDGFDVASQRELQQVLATGTPAEHVSIAGPGKRDAELAAALAAGVVVNVESAGELDRLRRIQRETGGLPHIALRVNPDFRLSGSGMSMGGGASRFGVDAERIGELAERAAGDLVGLHIFAGSQNLRTAALQEGVSLTFRLAASIVAEHGLRLRHLNIGGGLGIPYAPGDQPIDLGAWGRHLAREFAAWHEAHPECRVVVELGRYLVGEAGHYVSRVIDRKESRGTVFLVVDGGLHHHLAATGNFGQVIRRNYPISAVVRNPRPGLEKVTVVGPLCTPLDTLGTAVTLPACEVGDLVVIHQSGAYGLTASPQQFLSHPLPAELLL